MTTLRRALIDCLCCERGFEERRAALVDEYDLGDVAAADPLPSSIADELDVRDEELVQRIRGFDTAPLGLTLSGPAYRDNPIIYANRTFRDLTGYTLDELHGENPRLLQGPDTDPDAVARLHEAIDIWSEATVELRNYRRDGTAFRNRVTVVPLANDSGTIDNWLGVQRTIDD